MQRKLSNLMAKGASIIALAAPFLVFAQGPTGNLPMQTPPSTPITTVGGVAGIICTAINWLFTLLIILAILFIIVAAFRYLTAQGDPEKVSKANHALIYAAVAIVVGLLAKGIPLIVGNFLGAGGFSGC